MHALYSLFSEGKKQRDMAGKKEGEGGVGGLGKTHRHMEVVSISVVAGSSPLSFSLCSFFFFIFDLLRLKIGTRLPLWLLNLSCFTG